MRSFLSSCVCVLLVGAAPLVHAQKPRKPAALAKQSAGVSTSPSRRLRIGGSHVGILGILEIQLDPALYGPLIISVSNGVDPVIQSNGRWR